MRLRLASMCVVSAAVLTGCAIRPVPEDVASIHGKKLNTVGIVREIRCEVQDAIQLYALDVMRRYAPTKAVEIGHNRKAFAGLTLESLPPNVRAMLGKYDQAAIVYELNFDMTVFNDLGIDATVGGKFAGGSFGIGVEARNDRQRQNIRTFRYVDTFWGLASYDDADYCDMATTSVNAQYPIAGNLGLAETVNTFVGLIDLKRNSGDGLVGTDKLPTVPAMVETLLFTTTVSGSLSPGVKLEPVGFGTALEGPGFDVGGKRKDEHKLIISMSLPDDAPDKATARRSAVKRAVEEIEKQKIDVLRNQFNTLGGAPIILLPE